LPDSRLLRSRSENTPNRGVAAGDWRNGHASLAQDVPRRTHGWHAVPGWSSGACGAAGRVGAGAAASDFGSPPSGLIPIVFNDHTVYAKPDVLTRNRVLAALVKGGHIYVPLRSMFEQMGATVTVSADGKTVVAEKPGSSVSVTLNRAEVIINGETRPLDVPPMLYHGIILVPVRVISEGMGAYVQWLPARHVVVVRYIPLAAPPPPAPAPTAAPTFAPPPPPPPAVPTAAPTTGANPVLVHRVRASRIRRSGKLQRVRGRRLLRFVLAEWSLCTAQLGARPESGLSPRQLRH